MDRKKVTAFLINCQPGEFMAYADQGDKGTVVVGPDGKKFRFSLDQLAQAAIKMREKARIAEAEVVADLETALDEGDMEREEKEAEKVVAEEPKPEPKPAPKKRAPTKRSTSGTKTKAKAKPKQSKNSPAR